MSRKDIEVNIASDIISELVEITGSDDIKNTVESILIEYIVNKGGNLDAYRTLLIELKEELTNLKKTL
ncbi:MAG: hypothetical protein GY714_08865 [Desulfobacterales bacterium]|nr:hypothetical protein [Desulfobacterales bacterium]MCP4163850.1 hypothetical protein [Deltaproteobacteria bacterium]